MSIKYNFKHSLDKPERSLEHKAIIKSKFFLRKLYLEWYNLFLKEINKNPIGKYVELGSGGGFLKDIAPNVICSDILPLPDNDLSFSALNMPFDNNSLNGIFMIDTFHHIPDSEKFLSEASRTLKKGAKIIMVEPANSLWGRFIYRNFHHEAFNPQAKWKFPQTGPLSDANGAQAWIVFERDKKIFTKKFPDLAIENIKYHTPLRYLISGGLTFKQVIPNFSYPFFNILDKSLSKITKQSAMFITVTLCKK